MHQPNPFFQNTRIRPSPALKRKRPGLQQRTHAPIVEPQTLRGGWVVHALARKWFSMQIRRRKSALQSLKNHTARSVKNQLCSRTILKSVKPWSIDVDISITRKVMNN
jgi:hypothetical protein